MILSGRPDLSCPAPSPPALLPTAEAAGPGTIASYSSKSSASTLALSSVLLLAAAAGPAGDFCGAVGGGGDGDECGRSGVSTSNDRELDFVGNDVRIQD